MSIPLYDGPQFNPENVIVSQAACYLRPWARGVTPTALIDPLDNLELWTPWQELTDSLSKLWVPIGMTDEGVTNAVSRSTEDIKGEEQAPPVIVTSTDVEWNVNTVMIEDTVQTMLWAFGGGNVRTVAATSSKPGYEDVTVSEEMVEMTLGLEGLNEYDKPRRMIVPKVVSVADVEITFRRAEAAHKYEVSFRGLCKISDVLIRNYKTPKLAV